MNTKLILNKFKKVTSRIILNDFEFVNYLVGENGCGKTSILNALSYLNDGGNSRHFFGLESVVDFSVDNKVAQLFWNINNPNKTESRSNFPLNIYLLISNGETEKGMNNLRGKAKMDSLIGIGDAVSLGGLNTFLEETGISKLVAKKYVDQNDPFNQDNGRLIFESDSGTVDPAFIADGLKAKYNFSKTIKEWIFSIDNANFINIFIIEEPENNLHPNFQKEIPGILNSIFEKINPEIAKTIFFFISTHSPFIITASSKYENQKVYPLKNGKPLSIDFNKQSWIETDFSYGYKGAQCAYIVNKMLGADISDIGYPENYGILEEYSLQIILDSARDKGIIKNVQFVSASGISKVADLSNTIYEIEKLNTLIKCNPYYFDKYFIIIDNLGEINDPGLKGRMGKIAKKLDLRFVELSQYSLEDYYKNIDEKIWVNVNNELSGSIERGKGNVKAEYAKLISDKITDNRAFSILFNSELDFLLK